MTHLAFEFLNYQYDQGISYRSAVDERYPRHIKEWGVQGYRDSISHLMDQVIDNVLAEMEELTGW